MKKLAAYIFKFGHDNSKNLQNFNMDEFFGQNWFDISFWFMQGMLFSFSSISHDLETAKLLSKCPFNNAKNYVPINPLTAEWALRAPIDFTLSNARRFYSSMGNPLDGKGLKVFVGQCLRKWAKLEGKLKEVTDHNKKSGNSKRSWKYYEEMEECIGGNSSVNPQYTLESSSTPGPSDNISSSSDDEIQGTTP